MARKQAKPIPPSIESAMAYASGFADKAQLPQQPYATFIPGIGWVLDCLCGIYATFPINADHIYDVAVLPVRYFQ